MHSFDREETDGMSVKPFFARGRLMEQRVLLVKKSDIESQISF